MLGPQGHGILRLRLRRRELPLQVLVAFDLEEHGERICDQNTRMYTKNQPKTLLKARVQRKLVQPK